MLDSLKSIISHETFDPRWIGLLTNPFYFARKGLFSNISALAPKMSQGRMLDVGCGSKPYKNLFKSFDYVGMELQGASKRADFYYDGHIFPFKNGSFDSVLTSQVFEHVFNPNEFLSEIFRVLKDEGTLLMTVPFVWDEHEQPQDFARYSSFGLRHLFKLHGFEIVESRKTMDDVRVIFQMINAFIYKKTVCNNSWLNLILTVILMAPFNIIGEVCCMVLPKNSDLYLDNVILARKKMSSR